MRSSNRPSPAAASPARTPVRSRTTRTVAVGLGLAAALGLAACASPAASSDGGGSEAAAIRSVNVIAPADPGGGWDQTARAIAQVLTDEGIVSSAPVQNIGGAGGTVGLASLANETDPATLMITGLVMVGAVETNASEVRIEDMTPIARLTEEALVLVVPASSPYTTTEDLVDAIVEQGAAISVTGGSAGGADHILAGMLLTEAGVDPADIPSTLNYIPNSGGGEAVTMLLGNTVQAGISGVGEFVEQIEAGELRALAVSSPERVDLLPDTPTLAEEGYDVELTNWRGLLAPGGLSDDESDALRTLVTDLHGTGAWTDTLEQKGWADAFLVGDEFSSFLDGNIDEVSQTLQTIGLVSS
ncbi:Bug family tripartite tricarboxylate transporter substrate binding protein [Agromyces kandeliae]|uniref:Tripartite tricarboxylate transporter substrate binding protein n=1 Tax=Agromyces kandeliae TaxID=2666141 RepID=A0A6L5QY32_9MICO|nr:tripartite tricarboxylate transporter substrate-binding protein [Agromyces kandeliae]MRX42605.1 tripartite tricarboxylate transporter substrate binding protein [Agromyces kandeliae]